MTETKTNPLFRLMPSLTDIAFLLPVVFLFSKLSGVRTMLGDGDTGWHIRTGDWILAHGQAPTADIFSFTKPGEPWFAWEWLWDASFAWIHQHWGLAGVVLVNVAILCTASALLFKLVERRCGNPLIAIGLTTLAAAGASIHWLARPHLMTLLFLVIFLSLLERVRDSGRTKLLWWLPVLAVLWANMHGGFLAGIITAGAYGAGELMTAAVVANSEERRTAAMRGLPYLYAAAGCAAASLVNPYFYHLHVHIYHYLKDPWILDHIGEFLPANFRLESAIYLEAMLLLGVGAAVWYGIRRQFTDVLLVAGWGQLALMSQRNIPIFMMVGAVVAAKPLVEWLKALAEAPVGAWLKTAATTIQEIGEEIAPMERPWRVHAVSVVVIGLIGLAMTAQDAGAKFKAEYDPKAYPAAALKELNGPGQRVFTFDQWGDYLIYRLSPTGTKVFVDGRSDLYGDKFEQAFLDAMNAQYGWQKTLDRYGVDTILLPVNAPLVETLKGSRSWRVAYDDGHALVFRPAAAEGGGIEEGSAGSAGGAGGRDLAVAAVGDVTRQEVRKKN